MKQLVLVINLFLFLGCNQQQAEQKVDLKAEGEKVMQTSREWSEVASTRDVEKILEYWADNAVVMSAGAPVISGKQEIREMVEASFKTPDFRISWQPESVVVSESGDMAYLMEEVQLSYTDSTGKPVTLNEKAISIWRKQTDGTWKNAVEVSIPEASQDK